MAGVIAANPFKEKIGAPDDAFEREAERIADAVVHGHLTRAAGRWSAASASDGTIQRKCAECEEDDDELIRRAPREAAPDAVPTEVEPIPAGDLAPGASQDAPKPDAPASLLVDDESHPGKGQMRKSEFIAALRAAVCAAVDDALSGTGRDSRGCPWIDHWFGYYEGRSAGQTEQSLRRYVPEARGSSNARDYIAPVTARVRSSAATWARTGQVTGAPEDVPPGAMAGGGVLDTFGGMFFKARPGGARDAEPVSVRRELGGGDSLSGELRLRMESAFGASFAGVRIHNDAKAAHLSDRLNARAFTIGQDIAFGHGEFRPGTVTGDALIAHELAHVAQQRGAAEPTTLAKSLAGTRPLESTASLETDADRSAAAFVKQRWLGASQSVREVAPRLRTGLTLSRCRSNTSTVAAGKDFRAGTSIPDAAKQAAVQSELHPTAAPAGAPPAMWDAHSAAPGTAPEKTARKADLKTKVTQKMLDELTARMPRINALAASPRVPVTQLEGAGTAAKTVVDNHFGEWTAIAALTPSQATVRHGFAFRASGPGQNLFDANDPAQRAAAGLAVDAVDVADWMANTFGSVPMTAHNFSPARGGEEELFLANDIVAPFVAAHLADLEKFDLFGFALADATTGKIVTPTALDPGLSQAPGSGGAPSVAERRLRWSVWETLVHEYIHTLEHPVFNSAGGDRNRVMSEGFCTLFSEEVLLDQIPKAPKNAAIRARIEGGAFPEPPAGTVPPFSAGAYAEYLTHAKAIQATVGSNAMKGAFFQGHVELLGLTPSGTPIAPVAASDRDLVNVPAGITNVDALAAAAHVPVADILAANPGLTAGGPVSGQVHVPGAREHIVVEAGAHGAETKEQIARQNGVTQAALEAANPTAAWGALTAGDRLLIPKR
jgi:hypothetical protein